MKIEGIADLIKQAQKMQGYVSDKINSIGLEKNETTAEKTDKRLNDVWNDLDNVITTLQNINDI